MALPDLPDGFAWDAPTVKNPFADVERQGVVVTSGYRTQEYQANMRKRGYTPAPSSLHLAGDAVDLVPGKSGLSRKQLYAHASKIANDWGNGAKVLDESDHIHVQLPGWGGAPGSSDASPVPDVSESDTASVEPTDLPDLPGGFSWDVPATTNPNDEIVVSAKRQRVANPGGPTQPVTSAVGEHITAVQPPDYSGVTIGEQPKTDLVEQGATTSLEFNEQQSKAVDTLVRQGVSFKDAQKRLHEQFPGLQFPDSLEKVYNENVDFIRRHPENEDLRANISTEIPLNAAPTSLVGDTGATQDKTILNTIVHNPLGAAIVTGALSTPGGVLASLATGEKGTAVLQNIAEENPVPAIIGGLSGAIKGGNPIANLGVKALLPLAERGSPVAQRILASHIPEILGNMAQASGEGAAFTGPGHRLEGAELGIAATALPGVLARGARATGAQPLIGNVFETAAERTAKQYAAGPEELFNIEKAAYDSEQAWKNLRDGDYPAAKLDRRFKARKAYDENLANLKADRDQKLLELKSAKGEAITWDDDVSPTAVLSRLTSILQDAQVGREGQEAFQKQVNAEKMARLGAVKTEGRQGFYEKLRALKGQTPQIDFEKIDKFFSPEEVNVLFKYIDDYPNWQNRTTDSLHAQEGLNRLLSGRLPTESQLALLNEVLPSDAMAAIINKIPRDAGHAILDKLNIPRSAMSAFDISAPGRQAITLIGRTRFWSNIPNMFAAMGSEEAYQAIQQRIKLLPEYKLIKKAGVQVDDYAGDPYATREEAFQSPWAEEHIPGVRPSDRAYNGYLHSLRAEHANDLIEKYRALGVDVESDKFLNSLGKYINAFSGRGDLLVSEEGKLLPPSVRRAWNKWITKVAPTLNATFFSPKLIASRLRILTMPLQFRSMHPAIYKEAMKDLGLFTGAALGTLALASQIPGVKINFDDPTDAKTFFKIQHGNRIYDVFGGLQQYIVAGTRAGELATGSQGLRLRKTTKQTDKRDREAITNFIRGKLSPTLSALINTKMGETVIGEKTNLATEIMGLAEPLSATDVIEAGVQDAVKSGKPEDVLQGALEASPSIVGIGFNEIKPKEDKTKIDLTPPDLTPPEIKSEDFKLPDLPEGFTWDQPRQ